MPDELYFVQFPHPGGEPHNVHEGRAPWNSSKTHARKCLRSPGRWRTRPNLDAVEHEGDVVFWGEWEPPSRARATGNPNDGGLPKYVHTPLWHRVPERGHFHNTDPYVFGARFRYSNCRQNTKNGPRATQRLAKGSLILFGSSVGGDFVVDTVFVVARAQTISSTDLDALRGVDKVFRAVTLDLLYRNGGEQYGYRLYEGATPTTPVNGMFSFFPCLPVDKAPKGFPRPAIRLGDLINPACKQNFKLAQHGTLDEIKKLWHRVVRQVLDARLCLGVHADTPRRVPREYQPPPVSGEAGACGPAKRTAGCPVKPKC